VQQRQSQQPQSETLIEMATKQRGRRRRAAGLTAGVGATLLALFATGCPEPGDLLEAEKYKAPVKEMPMAEPCEVACVKTVFQESNSGCKICHATAAPLGELDLRDGYTKRLRDVPAKHAGVDPPAAPGDCPTGDKLIDTANPNASWLLTKIHGTQKTCGLQMPSSPLPPADMKCIEDYVACVAGKPVTGGGGAPSGGSGGSGTGGATGGGGTAAGSGGGGTAAGSGGGGTAAGSGGGGTGGA
jgi:hypothetical protein